MQYHVALTERCNLHCSYCGGARNIEGIPPEVAYDVEELVKFICQDKDAVIGFYGGEPLLALEKMYEIMDRVSARAFTLQTNATRLDEVDSAYLNRFYSILVSIDGDIIVTDANRGAGIYDTVIKNCRAIRRNGYSKDLVARMAFSKRGDIFRDVTHLLNLKDPTFDHVHWQLDVFWSDIRDKEETNDWLTRYDEGISRLVDLFGSSLEEGKVLGIVPFIPILRTLVTGEPIHHIWCGSGRDSFAVMTSGRIDACPIAPDLPFSHLGNIWDNTPESLRDSLPVGEPCSLCPDKWVCGGRCLFANMTMFWGRELFNRVCDSTRHMIRELNTLVELTKRLVKEGTIQWDILNYPSINNGCEIIP